MACSHTDPEPCAPRWRVILLLCGWFIATGAHWDVVQLAAWGKMWAENVRTQSSATAAFARTFSAEGMCGICHAVQAAKHTDSSESAVPLKLVEKAPLLPLSSTRMVIAPPGVLGWIVARTSDRTDTLRARPPVPPPRPVAIHS